METVCDNKTGNRHHNVLLCVLEPSCVHNYNLGPQEQREEEQTQSNGAFRPQYSKGHPISGKQKSTNKVKTANKQEHVKAERRISVELTYETDIFIYKIRKVNI